jgi:hypothetical protein
MFWEYHPKLDYHGFKSVNYTHNEKITLAIFNFFGTLVWSVKGELYTLNPDNLIYSASTIETIISTYIENGYTICILEVVKNINLIEPFKKCVQNFIIKNGIKANIIITSEKNFDKDENVISKILYDFFNPVYRFGKKSFYCGDEIDFYDSNPWYRLSDLDTRICNNINFKFKNPTDVFGEFSNPAFFYILNDLIITCGQEYSGYDIFYESIETDVIHLGMECKVDFFLGRRVYYILSEIFVENYKNEKLVILEDEHYVIVGSNPSLKERQDIVSKFERKDKNPISFSIGWFSRYPYQWSSSYSDFISAFESPFHTGERWSRRN